MITYSEKEVELLIKKAVKEFTLDNRYNRNTNSSKVWAHNFWTSNRKVAVEKTPVEAL